MTELLIGGSHYKLFDITRKRVFILRDIRFDETQRYADILGENHTIVTVPVATELADYSDSSDDEIDIPSNRSEPAPPSSRSPSPLRPRMVEDLELNLVNKAPKSITRPRSGGNRSSGVHLAQAIGSSSEADPSAILAPTLREERELVP